MDKGVSYKHDWYQTDSHVIITIFIKNAMEENVKIDFGEKCVDVSVKLPSSSDYVANFDLLHAVCPSESNYKLYSTKMEIKLKKREGFRWDALEGKADDTIKHITSSGDDVEISKPISYPSSCPKKHDWDKVESDLKRSEEEEKPEGDAALNQLFQKIYADGGEEVRKAMNKSFVESGGTVLSTNWKEIKEKQTEVKPPDGMEWRKWEN